MKSVCTHPLFAAVGLIALIATSACVAPDDFDNVSQECDGQRFDVPSRDRYCSGRWEKRRVALEAFEQGLTGQNVVQSNGKWVTTLERDGANALRLRFHEEMANGDLVSAPEWERTVDVGQGSGRALTSVAMLGLHDDIPSPVEASVAVVYDRTSLAFVDFGETAAVTSAKFDDPLAAIDSDPMLLGKDCVARGGEAAFEFADVTPIVDPDWPCERFLMIAAGCGVMVYGKAPSPGSEPALLAELPLEAVKLEVDSSNDRLMMASGAAGLKVRYMERLRQKLDESYLQHFEREACPVAEERNFGGGDPVGADTVNNLPEQGNNGSSPNNGGTNNDGALVDSFFGVVDCSALQPDQPRCQDFVCDRRNPTDIDCMDGHCSEGAIDPDCRDQWCVEGFVSTGEGRLTDPDCVEAPTANELSPGVVCAGNPRCFDGECGENPLDVDCLDGVCPAGGNDPDCRDEVCVQGSLWDDEAGVRRVDPDCLPKPLFDPDPGAQATDPSELSHINVTEVGFHGDRVFYVNEAIGTEGRESSTLLISGRLNPANTLDERTSLEVANDDLEGGEVGWEVATLGEGHFALLRRVVDVDGVADSSRAWLAVFDAPGENVPARVFDIPLEETPSAVFERHGELWVVYPDFVEAYTITISGDPR